MKKITAALLASMAIIFSGHATSKFDFDGDGKPDYVLSNLSTGWSAIWYLYNNIYIRGAYGPILPNGWVLIDVADFNRDSKPDYALYNPHTHRTAIWHLNNRVYLDGTYGPTLPHVWHLKGTDDFDGDGRP